MSISFHPDQNLDTVRTPHTSSTVKKTVDDGTLSDSRTEGMQVQENPGSYDTISIESHAVAESDQDFVDHVVRDTAASVRKGVSPERVAELKQQVQTGRYKPDSTLIARHLLAHQ